MQESPVTLTVDASGLSCPMPLLKAKLALNKVQDQQVICVTATDVNSIRDIVNFVNLTQHELIAKSENDGVYTFLIRKGGTAI